MYSISRSNPRWDKIIERHFVLPFSYSIFSGNEPIIFLSEI
jgi:hypothetical protein